MDGCTYAIGLDPKYPGAKLTETKLEGKFKLSQNRDKPDYEKVIAEFSQHESENNRELLKYMKLMTPEKFKK